VNSSRPSADGEAWPRSCEEYGESCWLLVTIATTSLSHKKSASSMTPAWKFYRLGGVQHRKFSQKCHFARPGTLGFLSYCAGGEHILIIHTRYSSICEYKNCPIISSLTTIEIRLAMSEMQSHSYLMHSRAGSHARFRRMASEDEGYFA